MTGWTDWLTPRQGKPVTTILDAAAWGDLGAATAMLEANPALVSLRDPATNCCALHLSVFWAHTEIAELLIAKGADVHAVDGARQTALHWAAERGSSRAVPLLLAAGADVNARDEVGKTPLHLAAKEGQETIAELLVSAGADVKATDNNGETPEDVAIASPLGQRMVGFLRARDGKRGNE